jgi:uncharacterized protein (DUF58 family)
VLFVRVPARSQREAVYRVRPQHRGVHVFGPARVTSRFPLGLVERSFELGGSDEVIVFPRIGRLTPRWHDTRRLGRRSSVVAPVRSGAYDDEFNRLREYRSGDNPRAIHWRTTARRNELMIREYQFQRDPDLILVVDLWTPDRPTNQDLANVELAVSFAATICSENGGAGAETGLQLIVCGREVSRSAGGPQSVRSLLEQLAVAQATRSSTVAEGIRLLEEPGGFERRRVLVTTRRRGELPPAVLAPQGANGNGAGSAHEWEVIVAEPTELSSYFEFEETLATVPS